MSAVILFTWTATIICIGLIISSGIMAYYTYQVFPEIGMVMNSQCNNPTPNWNGKIFNVPVWRNGFNGRNETHSAYYDVTADRRRLLRTENVSYERELVTGAPNMPIIFWGSHHKTGTYAAQKTFSHLCKRMNWCCIFHVTRDSVHVIEETLKTEPVHILGHTQWIWLPEELGQKNYRFLHFYRKPYAKIVSGYRYHKDGAEAWCKKPLPYAKACRDWSTSNDRNTHLVRPHVARMEVQDYCQSVHLCEPCCRREHEFENVVVTHPHPATKNITKSKKHAAALTDGTELLVNVDDHPRTYLLNPPHVYEFQCKHLGAMKNVSLMEHLETVPYAEGLRVEAAVEYFESLRMARIYNHTFHDPYSLNIDLDDLMSDYTNVMRQILYHMEVPHLSVEELESMAKELEFFDMEKSPVYKWSMTNPLVNHVNVKRGSDPEAASHDIYADTELRRMYGPILDLMHTAVQKSGTKEVSAGHKRVANIIQQRLNQKNS